MSGITITLYDTAAATIKASIQSPRSTDSDDEEQVVPFTTSPLENCRCMSSNQKSNAKLRDGRKKNKEGSKKRAPPTK
jgi:hypothetical protein